MGVDNGKTNDLFVMSVKSSLLYNRTHLSLCYESSCVCVCVCVCVFCYALNAL